MVGWVVYRTVVFVYSLVGLFLWSSGACYGEHLEDPADVYILVCR
jgi:hypothetical protein